MRKLKIFVTILTLYEFAMLTILQIPRYCGGFFNANFCTNSLKYFFLCIIVPSMVILFAWWLPEISRVFCGKCQCEPHQDKQTSFKEVISNQEIERFLVALTVAGIQKFIMKHPKTTKTMNDILDALIKSGAKKNK